MSLSDPGLIIYRNRRCVGYVRRGECVSNYLSAIANSANPVIKERHSFTPTESGIPSYDLQLWKLYLGQNNFNFGASFGKLQNRASSIWNYTMAAISKASSSGVGYSSWILPSYSRIPANLFATRIGYYIKYTIYCHCSFRGSVRI